MRHFFWTNINEHSKRNCYYKMYCLESLIVNKKLKLSFTTRECFFRLAGTQISEHLGEIGRFILRGEAHR